MLPSSLVHSSLVSLTHLIISLPDCTARLPCCWSYNPCASRKTHRFGLVPPRSPLLRESRLISLRRATEMFQFAHCPPSCLLDSAGGVQTSLWTGCPIRNLRAHRSHAAPPERFAGLRVLRRASAPRHPPRTLTCLRFSCCTQLLTSHVCARLVIPFPSTSTSSILFSIMFLLLSAKLK